MSANCDTIHPLTIGQAADLLGISRNRIKRLIQRGHLRPAETGADGGPLLSSEAHVTMTDVHDAIVADSAARHEALLAAREAYELARCAAGDDVPDEARRWAQMEAYAEDHRTWTVFYVEQPRTTHMVLVPVGQQARRIVEAEREYLSSRPSSWIERPELVALDGREAVDAGFNCPWLGRLDDAGHNIMLLLPDGTTREVEWDRPAPASEPLATGLRYMHLLESPDPATRWRAE